MQVNEAKHVEINEQCSVDATSLCHKLALFSSSMPLVRDLTVGSVAIPTLHSRQNSAASVAA
jgi:hypothetical protein